METPDAAAVRAVLPKFDWEGRVGDNEALQPLVDEAVAYVQTVTWRNLDSTMPASLASIALRAVALRAAQVAVQSEDDYAGTVNDDSISSFSIGPYSETRRDPSRRGEQKALNVWPALEQALWLLLALTPGEVNPLVDERHDYWLAQLAGVHAPAFSLTEVDWNNRFDGLGWGLPGPVPFLPDIP